MITFKQPSNMVLRTRLKEHMSGFTIVELMVGLAIGLIIALAAASAYLGSRGASVATENVSRINETGKLALDYIGREIELAGFFPAQAPVTLPNLTTLTNVIGYYTNIKTGTPAAYNQGLFGCDGARFKTSSGTGQNECPATVAGAADSIVTNYFTSDIFGSGVTAVTGLMRDCNGNNIASDDDNHLGRSSTNATRTFAVPPLPLIVSNKIGLDVTSYTAPNGQTMSSFSLACSGNGNSLGTYQPIFEGIEDLVIRYGVYAGVNSQSPEKFYTATEVSALPTVSGLNGWRRVTAVQVCIVVRSLDNSRVGGGGNLSYENCRGGNTDYSTSNKIIFKRFIRVFAARNNLNGTF